MTKTQFIQHMPFVHHRKGEVGAVIDYKSIIQAFIVAGVTAGISVFVTQKVMQRDVQFIRDELKVSLKSGRSIHANQLLIKHDVGLMHSELKSINKRLDKIDREIYIPRWKRN